MPTKIDLKNALRLRQELLNREIEIYGRNGHLSEDNAERLLKVCQCVADDEFYEQTKLESEQLEIYIYANKDKVNDVASDRAASYDYMQNGKDNFHNEHQNDLDDEQDDEYSDADSNNSGIDGTSER